MVTLSRGLKRSLLKGVLNKVYMDESQTWRVVVAELEANQIDFGRSKIIATLQGRLAIFPRGTTIIGIFWNIQKKARNVR